MAENDVETEIKIRLETTAFVIKKLKDLHAEKLMFVKQTDVLWDFKEEGKSFETYDQALRLRHEKDGKNERSIFTFKGTPTFDSKGIKSRTEYNIEISDQKAFNNILDMIGFYEALTVHKKRQIYEIENVEVCLDELVFGSFVELEGKKQNIHKVLELLELKD